METIRPIDWKKLRPWGFGYRRPRAEALHAQVARMADEQLWMQEVLPTVPALAVPGFVKMMERHAIELSKLAGQLEEKSQ
jgi:hypothetical protein